MYQTYNNKLASPLADIVYAISLFCQTSRLTSKLDNVIFMRTTKAINNNAIAIKCTAGNPSSFGSNISKKLISPKNITRIFNEDLTSS